MTDSEIESDEVDVEPYEGKPDFVVPPSHQHAGVEEEQDDEADEEVEGEALGDDLAPPELLPEPPRLQNFGDADA